MGSGFKVRLFVGQVSSPASFRLSPLNLRGGIFKTLRFGSDCQIFDEDAFFTGYFYGYCE